MKDLYDWFCISKRARFLTPLSPGLRNQTESGLPPWNRSFSFWFWGFLAKYPDLEVTKGMEEREFLSGCHRDIVYWHDKERLIWFLVVLDWWEASSSQFLKPFQKDPQASWPETEWDWMMNRRRWGFIEKENLRRASKMVWKLLSGWEEIYPCIGRIVRSGIHWFQDSAIAF